MPECMRDKEEDIRERLGGLRSQRSVIVGIGNRDRGDDGFGPAVIDALQGRTTLTLIDAGPAPESFAQRIAASKPDVVLFVDIADLGKVAGSVSLFAAADLAGGGPSCHTGSLALTARYVEFIAGARCLFLLAQPTKISFSIGGGQRGSTDVASSRLSPPVQAAVEQVSRLIVSALVNETRCSSNLPVGQPESTHEGLDRSARGSCPHRYVHPETGATKPNTTLRHLI